MVMDPRSPEVAMTVVLKAAWPALASEIDIRSEILHLAVGHGINVGAVGGDGHGPEIARGRDDRRLESRLASIGVGNRYQIGDTAPCCRPRNKRRRRWRRWSWTRDRQRSR